MRQERIRQGIMRAGMPATSRMEFCARIYTRSPNRVKRLATAGLPHGWLPDLACSG